MQNFFDSSHQAEIAQGAFLQLDQTEFWNGSLHALNGDNSIRVCVRPSVAGVVSNINAIDFRPLVIFSNSGWYVLPASDVVSFAGFHVAGNECIIPYETVTLSTANMSAYLCESEDVVKLIIDYADSDTNHELHSLMNNLRAKLTSLRNETNHELHSLMNSLRARLTSLRNETNALVDSYTV